MKRTISLILVLATLVCFTAACSSNEPEVGKQTGEQTTQIVQTSGEEPASTLETPTKTKTGIPEQTTQSGITEPTEQTGTPTGASSGDVTLTEPTGTPTVGPEKKAVSSFRMLTAGDNLLHSGILKEARGLAGDGEDFHFDSFYKDVKEQIAAADYAVINQESIILPKKYLGKKSVEQMYYRSDGSFVSPVEIFDTLDRLGFDAIDMANNHELDMGAAGLQWSLDYLNTRTEMMHFGGFYDEEDRANIRTVEINGIKVAFLAYTYDTNVSTEIAKTEGGFRFLVPYIDDETMIRELKAANEIADFTVVFVHWGTEYVFEPDELQKHTAAVLAENGAGIIIGHHSHTLQPIEYIPDGKGGQVLCAYSLGTLVCNMMFDMNMLAGLFEFTVTLYDDGSVGVTDPILTPTVFYYDMNFTGSRLMYLSSLTASMAASHGIGNYPKGESKKHDMTVERMYGYLHDTIANEFLPAEYRK